MIAMSQGLIFWRASGILLIIIALAGFGLTAAGQARMLGRAAVFDDTHNTIHLALGLFALAIGIGRSKPALRRRAAPVFAAIYLGLAVLGMISASIFGFGTLVGMRLELGENVLHLALGVWAAYVASDASR